MLTLPHSQLAAPIAKVFEPFPASEGAVLQAPSMQSTCFGPPETPRPTTQRLKGPPGRAWLPVPVLRCSVRGLNMAPLHPSVRPASLSTPWSPSPCWAPRRRGGQVDVASRSPRPHVKPSITTRKGLQTARHPLAGLPLASLRHANRLAHWPPP